MSWEFAKISERVWQFTYDSDTISVVMPLMDGAYRVGPTLYSVGPGRWNRAILQLDGYDLYVQSPKGFDGVDLRIRPPHDSWAKLLEYFNSLPEDPFANDSHYDFIDEDNNNVERNPNVLRISSYTEPAAVAAANPGAARNADPANSGNVHAPVNTAAPRNANDPGQVGGRRSVRKRRSKSKKSRRLYSRVKK